MLILVGSGPGVGIATAKLFATECFDKIILISRNEDRLREDRSAIIEAAEKNGRTVEVLTFPVDIGDNEALKKTLHQIEQMGQISCVLFNAARVAPSKLFEFEESALIYDFKVTNVALYSVARWAIPLLSRQGVERPSFLVTSGMLWKYPEPFVFALSMVKTSQRNLVQSLQSTFKEVHIAMLHIGGQVSPESPKWNPDACARKWLEIYLQQKPDWQLEVEI